MKREELDILLKEYETCHKEGHSSSATYWTIVGIFLSFATAMSAFLIKSVLEANSDILNSSSNERWVIFGLSLLALLIIVFLFIWLKRTNYFIQISNKRMRDLEDDLKNNEGTRQVNLYTIIHYLDKCECDWPNEHKDLLKRYKNDINICSLTRTIRGRYIGIALYILVSIPWIFLAIISASTCVKDFILR